MPSVKLLLWRYRYDLALLATGLLLLETFSLLLQLDRQTFLYPDAGNYLESSRDLFRHVRLHEYRPMLMAFVNGLPYLVGGDDASVLQWSLVVNGFCWLASGWLVFRILRPLAGNRWAFSLGVFFFTLPGCAVLVYHLLAESIQMFLLLVVVRLLQLYDAANRPVFLGWALGVLVASMLIKPVSLILSLVALGWFVRPLWRNRMKSALLPLYAVCVLVVLQMGGMKHQFGNLTISYIDGVTLHNYLLSRARCIQAGTEFRQEANPRADFLSTLSPSGQKQAATADLKLQLRENFPNLLKAYVGNMSNNASHGSYAVKDCTNEKKTAGFEGVRDTVYRFSIWQNRILTPIGFLLAGWVLLTFRSRPAYLLFAAATVVYVFLVSGISCGQGDRFVAPLYPLYLLLFGVLFLTPSSGRLRTASRSRT